MHHKNTNAQKHVTFVFEKFELHSNNQIRQHYQFHSILFLDIPRYVIYTKSLRNSYVDYYVIVLESASGARLISGDGNNIYDWNECFQENGKCETPPQKDL